MDINFYIDTYDGEVYSICENCYEDLELICMNRSDMPCDFCDAEETR